MSKRLVPSFLIPGAQKAGTSALFQYLSRHPDLLVPKEKEINYFWQDHIYAEGRDWYLEQFPEVEDNESDKFQTFEATPHYLHTVKCAKRIYEFKPDMKFIILLREPLSRAWSQFQMYQTKRKDTEGLKKRIAKYKNPISYFFEQLLDPNFFIDFDEALKHEYKVWTRSRKIIQPGLFSQGLYSHHIRNYFQYFDPGQFFFVESEELRQFPGQVLPQLEGFLNLSPHDWNAESLDLVNVGSYTTPPGSKLKHIFADANEELYQITGKKYNW